MNWPDETICKRILNLWALAYGSPHVGERANALAALKRLQAELGLSDVELAFIAEYTEKEPGARVDLGETSERPLNLLELLLLLLEASRIILPLAQAITAAL